MLVADFIELFKIHELIQKRVLKIFDFVNPKNIFCLKSATSRTFVGVNRKEKYVKLFLVCYPVWTRTYETCVQAE